MAEMYKILLLYGKYDTAVKPLVTSEHSYIMRGNDLRLEKSRPKYNLHKYFFTNRVVNIRNSLPKMLYYATLLINLNPILINYGNIKILRMIIKLNFTELEVEVHIIRTSYFGYQYFASFVFVMRALRH